MSLDIRQGDCRELMLGMERDSIDAIVTDPPYGLSFMGREWDHGVPGLMFWAAALGVVKPGAHLLAFGGTRTYHRLTCALEDAGWEIRDCLCWLYGSGFPKSLDVSKAVDKAAGHWRGRAGAKVREDQPAKGDEYERSAKEPPVSAAAAAAAAAALQGMGTALKPAWEPIILARKPLAGTVAANVLAHGTGALNVDGCRIGTDDDRSRPPRTSNEILGNGRGTNLTESKSNPLGRWPANVALDEEAARQLDEQSGIQRDGVAVKSNTPIGKVTGQVFRRRNTGIDQTYGGSGGASRFFYTAKAASSERHYAGKNTHPTVKPVDLMQWLCRLVTPPGGLILDPFCGSGSTGIAALAEGFRFVGMELNPEYVEMARRRIAGPLFAEANP